MSDPTSLEQQPAGSGLTLAPARRARALVSADREKERRIAGDKIRILRCRQRLSLTRLARALGLNRSTLKAIEEGATEPLVFDAYALANFFGLPLDVLFLASLSLPPLDGPTVATPAPPRPL